MTLLLAFDSGRSEAADSVLSEPPEGKTMILPLPSVSERSGYQPDRKRFASAFLVTTLIHVGMLAGFLTWHETTKVRAPAPPLIVTLEPLERPAATRREPAKPRKTKPRMITHQIMRPAVAPPPLASAPPALLPVTPTLPAATTPPQMPALAATPVARSAPGLALASPPARSAGKDSWEARVVARLESLKRYPAAARSRRDQGVATVRFRVNRQGTLLSSSLEISSGSRLLDHEALATVERGQPYPPIPAGRPDEIEVVVPVEFYLSRR